MAVALVWTVAVLSLIPLVQAEPSACDLPEARILDNSTMTKLTGQWFLTAATLHDSKFRDVLKGVQTSSMFLYPSLANDKFRMKFYISSRELGAQKMEWTCYPWPACDANTGMDTPSSGLISSSNGGICVHNQTTFYVNRSKRTLFRKTRNRTLSQEQQEEFQAQALCEGFSRNETIFFLREEDVCQLVVRNEELEEKEKRKEKKKQEEQPGVLPSI
ncbi:alpha-1-acid glycoprotein-like [Tachyglossus aculeatus]|uniref:alpha-1-acid glycoprotein-like n=1 Tax=Tachyglossus aculeatus TaxID=9261 RepID=UPI0018F377EF|nr:alpha-1-acid glycoprotein-like [Tachyglossus aculeatus]